MYKRQTLKTTVTVCDSACQAKKSATVVSVQSKTTGIVEQTENGAAKAVIGMGAGALAAVAAMLL